MMLNQAHPISILHYVLQFLDLIVIQALYTLANIREFQNVNRLFFRAVSDNIFLKQEITEYDRFCSCSLSLPTLNMRSGHFSLSEAHFIFSLNLSSKEEETGEGMGTSSTSMVQNGTSSEFTAPKAELCHCYLPKQAMPTCRTHPGQACAQPKRKCKPASSSPEPASSRASSSSGASNPGRLPNSLIHTPYQFIIGTHPGGRNGRLHS